MLCHHARRAGASAGCHPAAGAEAGTVHTLGRENLSADAAVGDVIFKN